MSRVGEVYNKLTVISETDDRKVVVVKCECGSITHKNYYNVKKGATKSCGCYRKEFQFIDRVGERYGRLTVMEVSGRDNSRKNGKLGRQRWKCLCDCGNILEVSSASLLSGETKSCGCIRFNRIREDLTGKKFNRWVVKSLVPVEERGRGAVQWFCVCECGTERKVSNDDLLNNRSTSCGCYAREKLIEAKTTHGKAGTQTYRVWVKMRERCFNPNDKRFPDWGGRGITVCDRWLGEEGFANFLEDMGEVPKGMSLDRIDNNGNYEPHNCRWANKSLQSYNSRMHKNNTTGKTGVYKGQSGKWIAQIRVNKKLYHLGTFKDFSEAVKSREEAEIKFFGFNKE